MKYEEKELITAEILAEAAHKDQTDKADEDYIEHVKRVASKVNSNTAKIIALLHDVLEDSSFTPEDLRKFGIGEFIIQSLIILTHTKDKSYDEYIDSICAAASNPDMMIRNSYVKTVKMADIEDNCDIRRLAKLDEEQAIRLFKKYFKAYKKLKEARWTVSEKK